MKEISIEKKFDLYLDTLEKCGIELLNLSAINIFN